jgi:hypothetical protein
MGCRARELKASGSEACNRDATSKSAKLWIMVTCSNERAGGHRWVGGWGAGVRGGGRGHDMKGGNMSST